jgi:hypothetical protein
MTTVCKPQKTFICLLMQYILAAHGKLNFRNLSRYGNTSEKTISRNFKKAFDFIAFNLLLVKEYVSPQARLIAGFDPSFIEKSGKHTEGLGKYWNGSAGRAEKGLEVSLFSLIDVDKKDAYALSAKQTIEPDTAPSDKSEETRVDQYLEHTVECAKQLPLSIKYLVVDAYFYKQKYVQGVRDRTTLKIIGKMRNDANLRYLFTGEQSGKGRPKKFDGKFDINDMSRLSYEGEVEDKETKENIALYSGIVHSTLLDMPVKIVVLEIQREKKVSRIILFSLDLELSATDIYLFYTSRFQIEFQFRDAKQHTGLADCQARSTEKLNYHFNASFMALNLAKVAYYSGPEKQPFSMASVKAHHYNEALIESFLSNSDLDLTLIKSSDAYRQALSFGTIHDLAWL